MTRALGEPAITEPGPVPVDKQRHGNAVGLVPHRHAWSLVSTLSGLRDAQGALVWDIGSSRILGINRCNDCGELHRGSVRACRVAHCRKHQICEDLSG